jgi:hypothetical protein
MLKIDQLRTRQEQRLVPVLESWNEANDQLRKAIALADLKEREFREVSEDVERKLAALDIVMAMASESGEDAPAELGLIASGNRPLLMPPEKSAGEIRADKMVETSVQIQSVVPRSDGLGRLLRRSSRPLFPSHERAGNSILSILR